MRTTSVSAHCRRRSARPGIRFLTLTGTLLVFAASPLRASVASTDEAPTELPLLDVTEDALHRDEPTLRPVVADHDSLSGRAVTTLKDALGSAPGLILQESFGGFEPPRLSIRGSGLQSAPSSRGVQFLLENFPLSLTDGSFNAALIDPELFDRVQLARGEAGARDAPAVLGGALNLRTPPFSRDARLLFRTQASSFGGARALLSGQTGAGKAVLTGAGSAAQLNGFREHSNQDRLAFFAQASRPIPVGCDTSVSVYHARADYDIPGPLTLSAAATAPRSISAEVRRDQPRRESEVTQLTAQTSQQNSVLRIEAGLSWLRSEDWFRQLRALGISDSRSDDLTFRSVLTRRFEGPAGDHLLRIGAIFSQGDRDLRRFLNHTGTTGPVFGDDRLRSLTASLDVEGTARLTRHLTASAGASGLLTRRDLSDQRSAVIGPPTTQSLHARSLQPRAQLLWSRRPELTFFVAAARTTEPPTFDDLLVVAGSYPNLSVHRQPLANQHATTWELGSTGRRGRFDWDVTAYRGNWTNEILRLADAQGLARGAVNAGPTHHTGVESSFHYRLLDHEHQLRLTATAVWSRFTFADDPVFGRNRLAGAPPLLGSAQLLYLHPCGFFATSTLEWTAGATPVDHAGRMSYGGHALTHLRIGWRQARQLSVFVEVRNLFDRDHIASTAGVLDLARSPATTAVFLPGAGRSLALGFEWSR